MQNNIINKISPAVRIIILFILSISLFIAKSIFLILFITTLTLILMLITRQKVISYVKIIKKIKILLLFLLFAYIIMFGYNIINCLIFIYKLTVVVLLFIIFNFNINFNQLHQAIYGCLKPLTKTKLNIEQISFDIVIALIFIKIFINKKYELLEIQRNYGKKRINFKNYIVPIFINSATELNDFKCNLKSKFYRLIKTKNNIISNFILIIFLIFLTIIFLRK